jgi:hypothetical protein
LKARFVVGVEAVVLLRIINPPNFVAGWEEKNEVLLPAE